MLINSGILAAIRKRNDNFNKIKSLDGIMSFVLFLFLVCLFVCFLFVCLFFVFWGGWFFYLFLFVCLFLLFCFCFVLFCFGFALFCFVFVFWRATQPLGKGYVLLPFYITKDNTSDIWRQFVPKRKRFGLPGLKAHGGVLTPFVRRGFMTHA